MHWADVIASELEKMGHQHRIATGITPSGHIHVGNMREILTGDIVHRAALDRGLDSTLYYLADDFDPLRKVYPFLPKNYSEYVGRPLSEIPSPAGDDHSYAEHFLEPFLESIEKLGVDAVVLPASISYREGRYAEAIRLLLDSREPVREILERVSGRKLPREWLPYNPKCGSCGRMDSTTPLDWEEPYVHYRCSCGHEGKADTRTDDGKLPWRLDWPARWYWLGVTCEPFGKDHAAAGGSYDTSSEIIRNILGKEPPYPVVYEWIQLKGKGAMSSSTGVVVSGEDMLRMTPPEVLRFMIAKYQPGRHIDMDPGLGILNLVDEFDRYEKEYHTSKDGEDDRRRTFEFSMIKRPASSKKPNPPVIQIPYRHLVTLVQLNEEFESLKKMVMRTESIDELDGASLERMRERARCVRFWLERFAPEGVKFILYDEPPDEEIERLTEEMREALAAMREDFTGTEWTAENIHNTIYEGSRKRGIDPKATFRAFYRILLGQDRGPRLGFFLSTMPREEVLSKLDRVLEKGK